MSIVFITLTNTGYIEYTQNCLKTLQKINCNYPLQCYCIGKDGFNILKNNGYNSFLIDEEHNSNFQTYRHGNWSKITFNKFKIIYDNLLNYDYVCITDGDITFENSIFMDYLIQNIGDNDLLIQSESLSDDENYLLCSGFMFIKSNQNTIDIFNPDKTQNIKDTKEWDDQVYINEIKDKLKYKKLPLDLFPNGRYYFKYSSSINPYLIHFNWTIGNEKKEKMKFYNKWIFDSPSITQCLHDRIDLSTFKFAFVKSSIYQDLWVSDITSDPFELFKTSLMRCSSIGLLEYVNTDFIIVKDSHDFPCKCYPYVTSTQTQQSIQFSKELKYPDFPFLDQTFHKHISIDEISHNIDTIQWSNYNIVITINACVPDRIIEKYPNILWCYFIAENEKSWTSSKLGKYDLLLNQDIHDEQNDFSIGFPYSFLGPDTLQTLYKTIDNSTNERFGIFMEINNTTERPVTIVPDDFLHISKITNIPILLHQQNILENLKLLNKSSYFVKIKGRQIRGYGIMEAISAGSLVLINKDLLMFKDLIPNECNVVTSEDVINKINFFENNKNDYFNMVRLQKENLEKYAKGSLNNLIQKYNQKFSHEKVIS